MEDFTPEPRAKVIRRRLVTIPRSLGILVLMIALAPIAIPAALFVDSARRIARGRPAMTLRLLAFAFVFFAAEAVGLARLFSSWLFAGFGTSRSRMRQDAWVIQVWWAGTLLAAFRRIFRIDLVVSGDRTAIPGPIIALFRHASIVDNLLPAVLLTADQGINMRWVVKRELLTLPSLDVAGKRLPNYFVDRNSSDPSIEIDRIRALSEGMGTTDGVLIYPEGTRYTARRRDKALERMRREGDTMVAAAERLRHVMPPRPGGTLALLDSGADVIVGAHQGLEGFAKLGDLWSGGLVGRTVNVAMWRIPAEQIPTKRDDRVGWLYDVWADIDAWIEARL
jgi:1-acyl-sn-glycerol-3-phosphate acyltransferase